MSCFDQSTDAAIQAAFRDYFAPASVSLPDPIPARGTVEGDGWHVRFVVNQEDPPHLDFFAENRMTNSRHVRIHADGSTESLETYQDAIITQPDEENWEQGRARQLKHNERVTEILRAKGLLD